MSSSPHDALFEAVFGQLEHARGALRSVVPTAVAEALDWSTLARCPGSFIDPVLTIMSNPRLATRRLCGTQPYGAHAR